MKIKYKKDWRMHPKWESVTKIELRPESKLHIVFSRRFGWILLSDCVVKEGNFNTKKLSLL